MSEFDRDLRCMLVPLRDGRLLLPNAAVAEVIGYREPDPMNIDLPWLQGKINWHQREIPIIDFEYLTGEPKRAAGIRQRIAVCHSVDAAAPWPLFGLVAQGIPRLMRVSRDAIESATGDPPGQNPVLIRAWIDGEEFQVPDFDYLLTQLSAA